jgi:hypothetical protein
MRTDRSSLLLGLFSGRLVCGQGLLPELIKVGTQRGQGIKVNPVNAPISRRRVDYEPCVLEDPKMLGDGRSAHGQFPRQVNDGQRLLNQVFDDCQPSRVAQRQQRLRLVSHD